MRRFYRRYISLALAAVITFSSALNVNAASYEEMEVPKTVVSVTTDEQDKETLEDTLPDEEKETLDETVSDEEQVESEESSETEEASTEETDPVQEEELLEEEELVLDDPTKELSEKSDKESESSEKDEFSALEVYEFFQDMDYVVENSSSLLSVGSDSVSQAIVTGFKASWSGHEVDLLGTSTADGEGSEYKTYVDFSDYSGKTPLKFNINIKNSSDVSSVDVIGVVDGKSYTLSADRINGTGVFEASGYFKEGSSGSAISSISLKLRSNRPISKVSKSDSAISVNSEAVERYQRFNEMCGDVKVTENGNARQISVAYDDFFSPTAKKIGKEALEVLVEEASPNDIIEDIAKKSFLCVTEGDDGSNYDVYFDTSDPKNIFAYFVNLTKPGAKVLKYKVSLQDEKGIYNSFTEFSADFSEYVKIANTMSDYTQYNEDYERMVSDINNSSIKDKDEAIKKARELRDSRQLYSATTTLIIPLVVACCGGLPGGIGMALLATGAKTFVDCAAEYLWEARAKDILGKEVGVTGKNSSDDGYINGYAENYEYDENGNKKVISKARLYGYKKSGLTIEMWGESVSPSNFDFNTNDGSWIHYSEFSDYITREVFLPGVKDAYAGGRHLPKLEEIELPYGLEAFSGADNPNIKKIKLPKTLKVIGDNAFCKSGIERINLSETQIEEIGEDAFEDSSLSGTVVIPASCTKIGQGAFGSCKNLKKVQIDGNIEKLDAVFQYSNIDELVINGNIDYLLDVSNSASIKSIYLLGKVKELEKKGSYDGRAVNNYFNCIEYSDFYTTLTKQEVEILGLRLRSNDAIHHYGYDPKTGKEAAVITGKCGANLTYTLYETDGSDQDNDKRYDLYISGTGKMNDYEESGVTPWSGYRLVNVYLGNGITSIGDYAGFNGNNIEIPGTVKTIGKYAFSGNKYNGILIIPDSVESIGEYAFANSWIKNVYIGKGLTKIPGNCFERCEHFNGRIVVPENITEIGSQAFFGVDGKYGYDDNDKVSLLVKGNNLKKVEFKAFYGCEKLYFENPEFIENLTYIGTYAFQNCKALCGELTFSKEIKTLDSNSFKNCTGISAVTFNSNLDSIGDSAFRGCTNLTSASLTGVRKIGFYAFDGCTSLQTLELGEGLETISWYAFTNCRSLSGELVFPSTMENIGMEAFKNCESLTSVKFNENLDSIGDRAFKNCTGLKGDLVFHDMLRYIGREAFKNCTGLDGNLIFMDQEGVCTETEIGYGAFENCKNITGTVNLNSTRFHNKNQWQRVFYGMDKVEEFLIRGYWEKDSFTSKGETGNYLGDDPDMFGNHDQDETGDVSAIVDISTFPANATLRCVAKYSYDNLKDLGYNIEDVSGEYTGYRLSYETGGHGLGSWSVNGQMTISFPTLTEQGYTFGGWYLTSECKDGEEAVSGTKLKADTTIYAKWTANQYKVTFDPGEGQIVKGNATKTVTFDASYGELPIAEFGDNAFAGWSSEPEGKSFVTAQTIVRTAGDHTLYAAYKQLPKAIAPTAGDAGKKELPSELRKGTKIYLFTATGGASIYYTTNAAEASNIPEDDAHLYKTALTAEENMTIYAKTVKAGYMTSDVMTEAFTVIDPSQDTGEVTDEDMAAKEFTSADKIPTGLWAAGYKDMDYTGSAITFDDLHVYYGKKLLTLNEDYTVKYSNNIKASTDKVKGTITVTGKGNYSGTNKFTFDVKPISLGDEINGNNASVSVADIQAEETGKVIKGKTTVTYTKEDGKIVVLKSGTDFTYDYSEVLAAPDTYNVIIKGKGNYAGFAVFTETVYPKKTKTNITKLSFTLARSVAADGSELRPEIKITDKSTDKKNPYDLVAEDPDKGIEGDYHVEYFNNILPGTATAVVTGKGEKYAGTKTLTFKITGIAISKAKVNIDTTNPVIFDGTGKTPGYTLTYQANKKAPVETLFEGEDFTVTSSNNVKKVNGTLTFTGIGKYTGTVKKTFKIGALNFSSGQVTVVCSDSTSSDASSSKASANLGSFAYTKNGVKPELKLMFGDEELVPNRDYKIKYANNNAVTVNNAKVKTPTITITGAGNYTGTFTRIFSIRQASLETATVTATDILESTKAVNCKPTITVYDTNGVKLVAGKDYDSKNIEFTYVSDATIRRKVGKKFVETDVNGGDPVDVKNDIVPAGTDIEVTLHGKGLYASDSSVSTVFSCVDNMISKATVKLAKESAQIAYTGSSTEINESDLQVFFGKKEVPKGAYRIIKVENNTGKGTAKITIAGTGLYTGPGEFNDKYFGGEKTVTFKIVARSIK